MIVELLLISAVVMMIFESGWWDNMDEFVNRKFKFHHLPKIFVSHIFAGAFSNVSVR